jgi:hypothetical protein
MVCMPSGKPYQSKTSRWWTLQVLVAAEFMSGRSLGRAHLLRKKAGFGWRKITNSSFDKKAFLLLTHFT